VNQLAKKLKIDADLLESFIKIIMCQFNPLSKEEQVEIGDAELAIKEFISILLPNLDIQEQINDICKLVLEKD
jgi:hypothetical protein